MPRWNLQLQQESAWHLLTSWWCCEVVVSGGISPNPFRAKVNECNGDVTPVMHSSIRYSTTVKSTAPKKLAISMYKSKLQVWLIFVGWLAGAFLCGLLDHGRRSTIFLPVYSVAAAFIVVMATRKYRPPKYRFEVMNSGLVRSPLGFDVRISNTGMQYIEGDHVVSWCSTPVNRSVGKYSISEPGIVDWDTPFDSQPMSTEKKQQIARAVFSASVYLQLVEAGKIRPKTGTSALA